VSEDLGEAMHSSLNHVLLHCFLANEKSILKFSKSVIYLFLFYNTDHLIGTASAT